LGKSAGTSLADRVILTHKADLMRLAASPTLVVAASPASPVHNKTGNSKPETTDTLLAILNDAEKDEFLALPHDGAKAFYGRLRMHIRKARHDGKKKMEGGVNKLLMNATAGPVAKFLSDNKVVPDVAAAEKVVAEKKIIQFLRKPGSSGHVALFNVCFCDSPPGRDPLPTEKRKPTTFGILFSRAVICCGFAAGDFEFSDKAWTARPSWERKAICFVRTMLEGLCEEDRLGSASASVASGSIGDAGGGVSPFQRTEDLLRKHRGLYPRPEDQEQAQEEQEQEQELVQAQGQEQEKQGHSGHKRKASATPKGAATPKSKKVRKGAPNKQNEGKGNKKGNGKGSRQSRASKG
jgi:hypothetical protein